MIALINEVEPPERCATCWHYGNQCTCCASCKASGEGLCDDCHDTARAEHETESQHCERLYGVAAQGEI